VEPDQPTDTAADEQDTPAAKSITQPPPAWRKVLDRAISRVLQNVVVRTVIAVMDMAGQAGAPLFAAALAFTTLFAVVPLLLLVAGLLGWLIQDEIQRSALLEQLVSYFPPLADVMATSLESVVRERGALSLIGLVGLVWGSSSYYAALDEVMRRIFGSDHVRGFFSQRLRGLLTVAVLVGLMLGTIALSSVFALVSDRLGGGSIWWLLFSLAALSVTALVVLAVYLLVPAAPPSWRAALPPAVAAGIGIGLLTNLFSLLTPWLIGGLLAFGIIATVFGALIWLSLSYQILLYGAAWARIRRDSEIRRGIAAAAATPYSS
jgi:membrane protein